jgi:hypothetical protein
MMEKCDKCGLKKGHKMSCPTQKIVIVSPQFANHEDKKKWGKNEKLLFDIMNIIANKK